MQIPASHNLNKGEIMTFEVKKEIKNAEAFVGFNVPGDVSDHLMLVSVHMEMFRSTIMRGVLNAYLETQPSAKKIFRLLARKAHSEWNELCIKMDKKNGWKTGTQLTAKWEQFVIKARFNLKKRKMNKDLIDIVITRLEQLEIDR